MGKSYFITKKEFLTLVEALSKGRRLYGPVKKGGALSFEEVTSIGDLRLFEGPTYLSARRFFLPPKETLLRFDISSQKSEDVIEAEEQALIGLHSCDVRALELVDRVFMEEGTPDPNYIERRKKTFIVATGCVPDNYCFCKSMGTMTAMKGFDLAVEEAGRGYIVRSGTRKGLDFLKRHTRARVASAGECATLKRLIEEKRECFTARIEAAPEELPLIYSASLDSRVWVEVGDRCYGCGSCNHVCPTCYCFDVHDRMDGTLEEGERYRVWDGCTLKDFAVVAGNHNFRKTTAERLRHRFLRKFMYQGGSSGDLFCVGCGRCSRACLVDINIPDVTRDLIAEQHGE